MRVRAGRAVARCRVQVPWRLHTKACTKEC